MTMAKIVLQATNDDQVPSEVAPSIALQPMDDIPEEQTDSAKNQGNTVDLEIFDRGNDDSNDNEISCQIKAEALEGLRTPKQVPEQININQVDTKPIQRNLQHMEKMESAFEDGYDTEEEIGPFWDATHREDPQDPEEITLDTLLSGNASTNFFFKNW